VRKLCELYCTSFVFAVLREIVPQGKPRSTVANGRSRQSNHNKPNCAQPRAQPSLGQLQPNSTNWLLKLYPSTYTTTTMADSNSTNNESGDDGDKPNKLQTSSSPSPSSQNNADKPPVFLSNNFHKYRMMKQQQQQRQGGEKGQESNNNSGIESKNQPQQHDQPSNLWKHFLAPLTPQPKNETETSPPTAQQTKHQPSSAATGPPIFSDLERSQTVDRFSNLFMKHMGDAMSSNKLSQAWQGNSGDNGSNSGKKITHEAIPCKL
jgi:hypothetical protein